MLDPALALSAAARPMPRVAPRTTRVLVLGGAGTLGTLIVERLVGAGRFHPVGVVATRPMQSIVRGLHVVSDQDADWQAFAPDAAVVVFDRDRRAHGREDALLRPAPAQLQTLARRLVQAGVQRLLVAVPHGEQGLPQALRLGLANLDEGAISAMAFDQLVFFRLATAGAAVDEGASRLQRMASLMLSQLRWMVPAAHAPVMPETVARVVVAVLADWAEATPATHVIPPELPWLVAQGGDAAALVRAWLRGQPLPNGPSVRRRW